MKHYDFEVTISQRGLPFFCLGIFFWGYIDIKIISTKGWLGFGIFMGICILCLIFRIVRDIPYCIKVKDSTIFIRDTWRKKYQFKISDVEKVVCTSQEHTKSRTSYYVYLVIKRKDFLVGPYTVGFPQMAQYIIDKYENGEMKKNSMTEDRIELFRWYAKGFVP